MRRARLTTPTDEPGTRMTTKNELLLGKRCEPALPQGHLDGCRNVPRPLIYAICCLQIEQEEEESAIDAKRRKRLGTPFYLMQLSCMSCNYHAPLSDANLAINTRTMCSGTWSSVV